MTTPKNFLRPKRAKINSDVRQQEYPMNSIAPIRYESGRPMLLGGLRRQHPFSVSDSSIPEQWQQFRSIGRLPGQVGTNAYGVMCGHNPDGFEYMCAVEVESFAGVPDNLGRMRIQAQDY